MNDTGEKKYPEARATRACLSCQQRRRWCDRTLPKCYSCAKARRQCDGYAPNMIRTFVNMNATNISQPNKKRLLCDALTASKNLTDGTDHRHIRDFSLRQASGVSKEMLPLSGIRNMYPNFHQHVEALWNTFLIGYCQTEDYWPPGCSLLVTRSRVLDLSLLALSAQRMALNSPGDDLHQLSLTAYNQSISLFLSLMQSQLSSGLAGVLAITSTIYALIEASLMQFQDIVKLGWGFSGHFDAALDLIQCSGPQVFSLHGFHLLFKKIREIGIFSALARCQATFLSTEEWMNMPWTSISKTWRDRFYDIAASLSEIIASPLTHEISSSAQDAKQDRKKRILLLEKRLGLWHSSWIREEHPSCLAGCDCPLLSPFSCICPLAVSDLESSAFALLQREYLSLQLLTSTKLAQLLDVRVQHEVTHHMDLSARSSQIAFNMCKLYEESTFERTVKHGSGITEALCRSIFPTWTIQEYSESRDGLLTSIL